MDRFLRALVVYLACAAASWAQPPPAPGELARIPLADALVLDPSVGWSQQHTETQGHTWLASLDVTDGRARATVAEAGMYHPWHRRLANRIDPIRYPVLVVAYRATDRWIWER
jgi:hypothetical protein